MLRTIHVSYGLPISYPVDPAASFQPGMIAQQKLAGNDIVMGISDGTAPFGIIDDVRAQAFVAPSKDEVVTVNCVAESDGYNLVAAVDTKEELNFSNIIRKSFVADVDGIVLNDRNGIITVPAGTVLNFDSDGDGIYDSLRTIVNYNYRIPGRPGDDSTVGSGMVTVWYTRGVYETDQYEVGQQYIIGATLYVSAEGKLTTAQPTANHPGVAMVSAPPTGLQNTLEFLWI